jgi:hypothetical protein
MPGLPAGCDAGCQCGALGLPTDSAGRGQQGCSFGITSGEHPELAVLSAIVHGRDADAEKSAEIALAAHSAAALLDTRRSEMYFDLVLYCLSEAARRVLQAMDTTKYQYQSEFARRYFGQGREEGNVEGRAEMALKLLSLRFGSLPEGVRGRVLRASASDLDALAERLLSAHTLDEALEDLG